jgi:hypothetical protein
MAQSSQHTHQHGPGCGHIAIRHEGHVDYLEDGHLQHPRNGRVDEHTLSVNSSAPDRCTPDLQCEHGHAPGCGHEAVPHGDHTDYLVRGRLHHPHSNHCDDHGPVQLV